MQCFYIEDFTGENVCMHCSTVEEAYTFLSFLDSIGRKWCNGQDYLENMRYEEYLEDTVYYFNNGTFSDIGYAHEQHYNVLEFADFDLPTAFTEELEVDEQCLDDFFSAFSISAANLEACV